MVNQQEILVALAIGAVVVGMALLKKRRRAVSESLYVPLGSEQHDLRRKATLVKARAIDHSGKVKIVQNGAFDLDKTIFAALTGEFREKMSKKFGEVPNFDCSLTANIESEYLDAKVNICPPVLVLKPIYDFMHEDCNFSMEHADGSFKDHLAFFQDYCGAYFKGHSPVVGLLHSITGVGTNYFPMGVELMPKLRSLLTPFEWTHVEAFPGMLRLIFGTDMLQQLGQALQEGKKMDRIELHRVIDNAPIMLTAEEFYVQLNYQLIHLLDFLPAEKWYDHTGDHAFCFAFASVYRALLGADKLIAQVDLDLPTRGDIPSAGSKTPQTLGALIDSWLDLDSAVVGSTRGNVAKFSGAIGHSLGYKLTFVP